MELGQRIKEARLAAGLSQRQLCGDVITRNMLSQIENGSARPSMDTLRYLAAQLEKPLSFFLMETVASANQDRMQSARQVFATKNYAQALQILESYQHPDAIFDAEYYLLRALCAMELASQMPPNAAALLAQAHSDGQKSPYFTQDLERRRLLLLAKNKLDHPQNIASALPSEDEALLLFAQAAFDQENYDRCQALFHAAQDPSASGWQILMGDLALAQQDPATAAGYYEKADDPGVYRKLEQCYLQLENYKMAYFYACKQR